MTCDPTKFVDNVHSCFFDGFTNVFTELQFATVIATAVVIPLYLKYEDAQMAAIGLLMTSGLSWVILPAFLRGVAWTMIFLAIAGVVFATGYKHLLE